MYTTLEGDRSFRGLRNAFKIYKYLFIKKEKKRQIKKPYTSTYTDFISMKSLGK